MQMTQQTANHTTKCLYLRGDSNLRTRSFIGLFVIARYYVLIITCHPSSLPQSDDLQAS